MRRSFAVRRSTLTGRSSPSRPPGVQLPAGLTTSPSLRQNDGLVPAWPAFMDWSHARRAHRVQVSRSGRRRVEAGAICRRHAQHCIVHRLHLPAAERAEKSVRSVIAVLTKMLMVRPAFGGYWVEDETAVAQQPGVIAGCWRSDGFPLRWPRAPQEGRPPGPAGNEGPPLQCEANPSHRSVGDDSAPSHKPIRLRDCRQPRR